MTSDEYRQDPAYRDELAKVMTNPALQQALAIVKSKGVDVQIPLGMAALDHARALAEIQTRALVIAELLQMTTTMPDEPDERKSETFGTAHTVEEFDNPTIT